MQRTTVICKYCNREISKSNITKHESVCKGPKISYKLNHDGLTCQFCGKECKNRNSLCNHERMCTLNPNKQDSGFIVFNEKVKCGEAAVWNSGLTAANDERVAKHAKAIAEYYTTNEAFWTGKKHTEEFKAIAENVGLNVEKDKQVGYGITTVSLELMETIKELEIDESVFDVKYNPVIVEVVEKPKKTKGFAIPKPAKKRDEPLLDEGRLATLQEQTKAAQDMLAEIFMEEEEQVQDVILLPNQYPLLETLSKLLSKEQWTRNELEGLVGPDVMLGNLLEQINDYAYSKINDVVVEEDGDIIYVTTEYKEQLI
jgi:hypothetical protein